ncbi:PDZ and LIM domain protein 2-like [Chanos chanos]|uniref:PDZ and LIM domain protein 2 n=1 Tax=Chanos chanos TaxID=29144 RepID=A0A6J2UV58_CHACN|nr:PDZ and LIM domain protein 2-like [Chanos chanos]
MVDTVPCVIAQVCKSSRVFKPSGAEVNADSKAEVAGLQMGDVIMEINGESAVKMLNVEAQEKIRQSRGQLRLLIDRPKPSVRHTHGVNPCELRVLDQVLPGNLNWSERKRTASSVVSVPQTAAAVVSSSGPCIRPKTRAEDLGPVRAKSKPQSVSASLKQIYQQKKSMPVSAVGRGPVTNQTPPTPASTSPQSTKKSVSFASPVWRYVPVDSEDLRKIRQNQNSAPRQSNTFRLLEQGLEAECRRETKGHLQNVTNCQRGSCSMLIKKSFSVILMVMTQAVRIREGRYRHVACYTCRDCGLSLMVRGHFWVDEELYCGKHARQRYQAESSLQKLQSVSKAI